MMQNDKFPTLWISTIMPLIWTLDSISLSYCVRIGVGVSDGINVSVGVGVKVGVSVVVGDGVNTGVLDGTLVGALVGCKPVVMTS